MSERPTTEESLNEFIHAAVVDRLADSLRRNLNVKLENAQGEVGELWIRELLDDEERVEKILGSWRSAQLGGSKEGTAANSPDWLIVDKEGKVNAIIEVKAVKDNQQQVEEDRVAFRHIWGQEPLSKLVYSDPARQEEWQKRIESLIRPSSRNFTTQIVKHLVRLQELKMAGVLQVGESVNAFLYIPESEKFQIGEREMSGGRFEVRSALPSLKVIGEIVQESCGKAGIGQLESSPKENAAFIVAKRSERVSGLLKELQTILGTERVEVSDEIIAMLLLGDKELDTGETWSDDGTQRPYTAKETGRNVGRLLRRLNSTAPSLTAHLLFVAAGDMVFSNISRQDRIDLRKLFSNIKNVEDGTRLIHSIVITRDRLARNLSKGKFGFTLPPITGVVEEIKLRESQAVLLGTISQRVKKELAKQSA